MKTPEGCTAMDSVMMLYSFAPFTMPNAFSPNGDGYNDQFRPVTVPEKVSSFSMYIYNRWGQQVFATKDMGTGRDGSIDGSPAPRGVYTYIISYSNAASETRKKSGMVTLVR
jgi:gliding motility-associated-like protein